MACQARITLTPFGVHAHPDVCHRPAFKSRVKDVYALQLMRDQCVLLPCNVSAVHLSNRQHDVMYTNGSCMHC
jgi:hypothetical protein